MRPLRLLLLEQLLQLLLQLKLRQLLLPMLLQLLLKLHLRLLLLLHLCLLLLLLLLLCLLLLPLLHLRLLLLLLLPLPTMMLSLFLLPHLLLLLLVLPPFRFLDGVEPNGPQSPSLNLWGLDPLVRDMSSHRIVTGSPAPPTWAARGLPPDLVGEASRLVQRTARRFQDHHPPPTIEAGSCHLQWAVEGWENLHTTQNDASITRKLSSK